MAQYHRNFHQLFKIDTFAIEKLVDIRFLTIDLSSQPIDCAALSQQFIVNHLAHMNVLHLKIHNLVTFRISSAKVANAKHAAKFSKKNVINFNQLFTIKTVVRV